MRKFPVDAPKGKVVKALEILGFRVLREKQHMSMVRENPDGSKTPLTMPNQPKIKTSTWDRLFAVEFHDELLKTVNVLIEKYSLRGADTFETHI